MQILENITIQIYSVSIYAHAMPNSDAFLCDRVKKDGITISCEVC